MKCDFLSISDRLRNTSPQIMADVARRRFLARMRVAFARAAIRHKTEVVGSGTVAWPPSPPPAPLPEWPKFAFQSRKSASSTRPALPPVSSPLPLRLKFDPKLSRHVV